MKGFLKGLRYIQQIFENEEEPELQIGVPTDVKHVSHIGWDGPTANAPSWMKQYKNDPGSTAPPSDDHTASIMGAGARDAKPPIAERRILTGDESPSESPSRRHSDKSKPWRRHNSGGSGGSSVDSPKRSVTDSRRLPSSGLGLDSPARDSATVPPKSTRRKKSKNAASGESSRGTSRSKNTSMMTDAYPFSDPGAEGETDPASGLGLKTKVRFQSLVSRDSSAVQ
ncbi:hypothetical protein Dimus_000969 [Dionaea muscipula]